ncbi:MAG: squalene/phytoene synthase family protein, partial [Planctomycetota bacterium]
MTPENTPSTAPAAALGTAQLDALLQGSSRTFALSIPLMPEPVRRQTTIAYLLFRIADTFEDEPAWSTEEKLAGLETV